MNGLSIQLALGGLGKASDKKLAERYKKKFCPDPANTSMNQTGDEEGDTEVIMSSGIPGADADPDAMLMQELERLSGGGEGAEGEEADELKRRLLQR